LLFLLFTKPWQRFGKTKGPVLRTALLVPIFAFVAFASRKIATFAGQQATLFFP
jgi:hypothetical protein